ncbi:MAG: hypothetical protein K1X89_14505 [Myxococcaceae bacterium]|nr:hypothetical protein [Myxococcaceae bacterium]
MGDRAHSKGWLQDAPVAVRKALVELPDAETVIDALVGQAQAARPAFAPDARAVRLHFAARLAESPAPAKQAQALQAEDLYWAYCCGTGDRAAIAAFTRELLPRARASVAHLRMTNDLVEELQSLLTERFLIAPRGSEPKVLQYSGRGTLASFLCVAAVRQALDLLRQRKVPLAPLDDRRDVAEQVAETDPAMAVLRRRHRPQFKRAFEESFAALSPEERNLLRLSEVEGLGIDALATMFGAHRATMARRLVKIRSQILSGARERLGEWLELSSPELDSLLRELRRDFSLSVNRLLQKAT